MVDTTKAYQVRRGFSGVAVRVVGYKKRWEPEICFVENEAGETYEEETGEGEWVEDTESGRVYVRMVGDDANHLVDVDDLIELTDSDYCGCCGQIGCAWGAAENEETRP
jgi:hypothetical protein